MPGPRFRTRARAVIAAALLIAGLGLGFVAVTTVLITEQDSAAHVDFIWLCAAFTLPLLLSIHTLLMSKRPPNLDATLAVGMMMALSSILLLPFAAGTGSVFAPWSVQPLGIVLVVVLGISSAFALVLALKLVTLAGPVFASQMAYTQSLAGIIWAMLLLGETLSIAAWGAFLAVVIGVWLVSPKSAGDNFRASLRPGALKRRKSRQ